MRRLLAVVAVLALSVACGGGDDPTPFEVISSARSETLGAESARMSLLIEAPGSTLTGGQPLEITGEGSFDFAERVGALTMDLSSLGLPGASGQADLILTGDVLYMKLPPSLMGLGGLSASKPWLRIDLQTVGGQAGVNLSSLQQVGSSDPTSALNYLEGVSASDIETVGEAEVRGESTTHYRVTVDLERAKAQVADDLKDDFDQLIEQLGTSTFPAEVWVDGDERVRRIKFTIDPAAGDAADAADAAAVTITQDLYDFGTEVEASPPPDDQVTDFSQLLQGAPAG